MIEGRLGIEAAAGVQDHGTGGQVSRAKLIQRGEELVVANGDDNDVGGPDGGRPWSRGDRRRPRARAATVETDDVQTRGAEGSGQGAARSARAEDEDSQGALTRRWANDGSSTRIGGWSTRSRGDGARVARSSAVRTIGSASIIARNAASGPSR